LVPNTGFQESEFSTEEIAVDRDFQELKYLLEILNVAKSKMELKTENGTLLTVMNQFMEQE